MTLTPHIKLLVSSLHVVCGTGGTIRDLLISQLEKLITIGKEAPKVIPSCIIQSEIRIYLYM